MTRTMHAAVVEQFGEPLSLREWGSLPLRGPDPGQDRSLRGVPHRYPCRAWRLAGEAALPFIPGHEGIGLVAAVGSGVTSVKEGDRVGVPWLYSACGHCEYCLGAWETVCPEAQFGGYTRNGGFAE